MNIIYLVNRMMMNGKNVGKKKSRKKERRENANLFKKI